MGIFDFNKKMNRALIHELATARFTERREDALFLGPPGAGKSHLAQAIGRAAIHQAQRVLYREARTLTEEMADATIEGTRKDCLAELAAVPLLIIDDLGMRKLPDAAAEGLLELVMRRYERAFTLLTSNRLCGAPHKRLELFSRYLRGLRFNAPIRGPFRGARLRGDFGVVAMVRLLTALLVAGGRRLEHVAYVADDRLVRRFCRLQLLPTARPLSRRLTQFTMTAVERLQALNAAVVASVALRLRLRTLTVDVDGVVVSTRLRVERAFRGFNRHQRKVLGYYAIMAHLAETTHVLRVQNRSGNVHDVKASLTLLRDVWNQLTSWSPRAAQRRFRMDGAFFRPDVRKWPAARGARYAIKVPFCRWLDLQQYIRTQLTWSPVAPDVSGFVVPAAATPWGHPVWVAIYRTKVTHRAPKALPVGPVRPQRWAL